jgi:broad specificity phosphatase PhoE
MRGTPEMQIALVRHGRPDVDFSQGAARHLDWVEAYDLAGIDPALPPPARVRELAAASAYALSSDLLRAVDSLAALAGADPAPAESLFREVGLRGLPVSPLPLPPRLRAPLARFGWRVGWSLPKEGPRRLHRRAGAAARRLSTLAATHGSVLLLGHGYFNTLIAWRLLAAGWRGPVWPTGSYWSVAVYRKGEASSP